MNIKGYSKAQVTSWLCELLKLDFSEVSDVDYILRKGYLTYILAHSNGSFSTDKINHGTLEECILSNENDF